MISKILSRVRRLLARLIAAAIRQGSTFIPSQRRLVLFGAMNGVHYADNSRHLFEWVHAHRPDLAAVWITRDRSVHDELASRELPVALANSARGIYLLMRTRAGVFTNSLSDIAFIEAAVPDRVQLLSLRHGQAVKAARFALETAKPLHEQRARRREGDLTRFVISTSDFISDLQETCLRLGRHKHIITGYPRNDALFEAGPAIARWREVYGEPLPSRVILYAPTWRGGATTTRFFPFDDFDLAELVEFLDRHDSTILLRPHVNDLTKSEAFRSFLYGLVENTDRVRLATHDQYPDVNDLLPIVDCLVTDYSSIVHDFLLLDRPMVFVPYDYAEFRQTNGFLTDYWSYIPGPAVGSFGAFRDYLAAVGRGEDPHRDRRAALRARVHVYSDGQSCARTAGLIDRMLGDA